MSIQKGINYCEATIGLIDLRTGYGNIIYILYNRDAMIDTEIEDSVARTQAVVELGRVIRDRKTMPFKVKYKNNVKYYNRVMISLLTE